MSGYRFASKPLANSESIVAGPQYRFTIINDVVLRYEWSEDGVFEDRASTFAINRNFPTPKFTVKDDNDQLQILGPSYHLTYDKRRFSANGLYVAFKSKLTDWGSEWRYGDEPRENMGGTARTLDEMNGRCDMGTGIISRIGFAALDDSQSVLFDDEGGLLAPRRPGDRIDGYLFSYGQDYKGAMKAFYAISGPQPTVPRWSLGNWWSRYYAYNSDEYLELMDKFAEKKIPLSVAVIDIDWHPVAGDDVPHAGWTGYTWNKKLFPDPPGFLKALHDRGLKTTLNDHPHSGIHKHEDMYQEVAKALGQDTSDEAPVLFDPTSPKFMQAYFEIVHRKREKEGCDFWWIDWQQGPYSRVPGVDPLWVLNHFQYLDSTRDDAKSIIFSRYGGPGSHRYPVGFSGDSHATWPSLEFQPEFTATASNIGFGWWSHDIGGHTHGYRDDELTVRWVQFGALSPILRLHSSNIRWMSKEPWRYRSESEEAMNEYLQLRHRLVPYIYSIVNGSLRANEPLVQPMYWEFPTRPAAYRFPNQYYFGSSLVVNPVVTPRDKRTNFAQTKFWVPPGRHIDIMTGYVYDGDREIETFRSLRQTPIFAAEGAIIPLDIDPTPKNGCLNPEGFELLIVVGQNGRFEILEDTQDDAKPLESNKPRSISIRYDHESGELDFRPCGKAWKLRFISFTTLPSKVQVLYDKSILSEAKITTQKFPKPPGIVIEIPKIEIPKIEIPKIEISKIEIPKIEIPKIEQPDSIVTVKLGESRPSLSTLDYMVPLGAMVEDFQMDNHMKDSIWGILENSQPVGVKIGRLISLDLDDVILGPILELLSCDSRS